MKLGVIGCGKMGRALVGGILKAKICEPGEVVIHDAWPEAAESMAKELKVSVASSNAEVVDASEVVLLCVKPQAFSDMLAELGESRDRLLVSIAAGVLIGSIEAGCGNRHRVVRAMPNTPALVGKGASAFALGSSATEEDAATAEALLGAVGYVCRVEEKDLDAVTALSGSGPAYIFLMIEALVAAGVEQGLTAGIAHDLAAHTVAGAAELILQTSESPARLRENVTSPNGTTFAALESLRSNRFQSVVEQAVMAAAERSRELGRG
ncbi:MAG: pyrroline-5-carboxylate reductase [Verrucomicrobiales bacterium]